MDSSLSAKDGLSRGGSAPRIAPVHHGTWSRENSAHRTLLSGRNRLCVLAVMLRKPPVHSPQHITAAGGLWGNKLRITRVNCFGSSRISRLFYCCMGNFFFFFYRRVLFCTCLCSFFVSENCGKKSTETSQNQISNLSV